MDGPMKVKSEVFVFKFPELHMQLMYRVILSLEGPNYCL
jgi:hypothetical protein